jgi:pimeloyl-ACP methyl ester carboxylesterase
MPGVGRRVLEPGAQREYWYQPFHRLGLPDELIDGRPDAVRAYLSHFWSHWSGPDFRLPAEDLERLVGVYGAPGAFLSSIAWYRAGSGTVATSLAEEPPAREDRLAMDTTVLWPTHDPLFPPEWGDRLEEFYVSATVRPLEGVGHFTPLEAPEEFAAAIRAAAA